MKSAKFWNYEAYNFDCWNHAHNDPANIQIEDMIKKNESMTVSAKTYLNDLKEAFEAGRRSVLDSDDFEIMCIQADTSVQSMDKYTSLIQFTNADIVRQASLLECARRYCHELEGEYCRLLNKEEGV